MVCFDYLQTIFTQLILSGCALRVKGISTCMSIQFVDLVFLYICTLQITFEGLPSVKGLYMFIKKHAGTSFAPISALEKEEIEKEEEEEEVSSDDWDTDDELLD